MGKKRGSICDVSEPDVDIRSLIRRGWSGLGWSTVGRKDKLFGGGGQLVPMLAVGGLELAPYVSRHIARTSSARGAPPVALLGSIDLIDRGRSVKDSGVVIVTVIEVVSISTGWQGSEIKVVGATAEGGTDGILGVFGVIANGSSFEKLKVTLKRGRFGTRLAKDLFGGFNVFEFGDVLHGLPEKTFALGVRKR
jgi:hypothetical protein